MNVTQLAQIANNRVDNEGPVPLTPVTNEEDPRGFASLMKLELPEEEEAQDKEEVVILDGPYVAPLVPPQVQINNTLLRLIAALPLELQVAVKPLPEEIKILHKTGIAQIRLALTLPSNESVEVVIDQYDTAPSAFHISFYGSDKMADLISLKQSMLLNVLQTAFPLFSFAISPPFRGTPSFSLPKSKRFGYSPVNKGKSKK